MLTNVFLKMFSPTSFKFHYFSDVHNVLTGVVLILQQSYFIHEIQWQNRGEGREMQQRRIIGNLKCRSWKRRVTAVLQSDTDDAPLSLLPIRLRGATVSALPHFCSVHSATSGPTRSVSGAKHFWACYLVGFMWVWTYPKASRSCENHTVTCSFKDVIMRS